MSLLQSHIHYTSFLPVFLCLQYMITLFQLISLYLSPSSIQSQMELGRSLLKHRKHRNKINHSTSSLCAEYTKEIKGPSTSNEIWI